MQQYTLNYWHTILAINAQFVMHSNAIQKKAQDSQLELANFGLTARLVVRKESAGIINALFQQFSPARWKHQ